MTAKVSKVLSDNDLGLTGAHQAGILVPKVPSILSFFPTLDATKKNPRQTIVCREKDSGERWEFEYIYYNGRLFSGTRNEYRLTRMTRFLRSLGAVTGDRLAFSKDSDASFVVQLERVKGNANVDDFDALPLKLSGTWKFIP